MSDGDTLRVEATSTDSSVTVDSASRRTNFSVTKVSWFSQPSVEKIH